jgi:hypothetical protein
MGSLLLIDLVLVGLTVLWRYEAVGAMRGLELLACVVGVSVGAWAAVLAVWLHFKT